MNQIGKVIEINGGMATIFIRRASACGESCAHCKGGCAPTKHRAAAENCAGAKVGDLVKIETPDGAVLRTAALVYLLPIVIMLASFGAVYSLTQSGDWSVIAAFAGLAAGFFILRAVDRKTAPTPVITAVLGKEGDSKNGV